MLKMPVILQSKLDLGSALIIKFFTDNRVSFFTHKSWISQPIPATKLEKKVIKNDENLSRFQNDQAWIAWM